MLPGKQAGEGTGWWGAGRRASEERVIVRTQRDGLAAAVGVDEEEE